MKNIYLLLAVSFLFFGCASKEQTLKEQLNSFSINKDIYVSRVPQKVDSNFKINLGTSSYLKNVGIHLGTVIIPKIENNDGLDLQNAVNSYAIDLEEFVFLAFDRNFREDEYFKNIYVPFGGVYNMSIDVISYRLDSSLLSDLYQIKTALKVVIKNDNNQIVYEKSFISKSLDRENLYFRDEILSNRTVLEDSLNFSLNSAIKGLVEDMKKN